MSEPTNYRGYRFPPDIIRHAVWLYFRFGVSFRDVEDLLAERGGTVTDEAIRHWCLTFALDYARRLRRRRGRMGDTWQLDEVFVKIRGQLQNPAVREQSGRSLPSTDTSTGTPDATLQVRCPPATLRVRAWHRAESLPGRSTSPEVRAPPPPSHPSVR
jgi:putative transposase